MLSLFAVFVGALAPSASTNLTTFKWVTSGNSSVTYEALPVGLQILTRDKS
jgi:hypothetical protein